MKHTHLPRIFAFLLALVTLLTLASCGVVDPEEENTPEGMQIATVTGDDFRLYVPTSWSLNTAYGYSGAYYSFSRQSTVTAVKYGIGEEFTNAMADAGVGNKTSERLDWFYEAHLLAALQKTVTGEIEREKPVSDILGEKDARRYHYNATVNGEKLFFVQVVTEKDGAFYVLTFTAVEELYQNLYAIDRENSDVAKIIQKFKFDRAYVPAEQVRAPGKDESPVEGMKFASNDEVAYLFYVPDAWQINEGERIFAATSADGRAVVSVVPYMPSSVASSVTDYFVETERMLKNTGDYKLLGGEQTTLGGGSAMVYEYLYGVDGTQYRYRQYIGNYKGMIYSLTYAALEADYETHLADFNAIVNAFSYR